MTIIKDFPKVGTFCDLETRNVTIPESTLDLHNSEGVVGESWSDNGNSGRKVLKTSPANKIHDPYHGTRNGCNISKYLYTSNNRSNRSKIYFFLTQSQTH